MCGNSGWCIMAITCLPALRASLALVQSQSRGALAILALCESMASMTNPSIGSAT